jgi:hypothetical protein
MTRKKFVSRYSQFVQFALKLAHKVKLYGIESLEEEVEDIDETEKVFKEGLRLILAVPDPAAIVNEVLSNMIAHEKDKYMRLYMTVQKRAALGLLADEGTYILNKVLISLVDLTRKESRNLDTLLFTDNDAESEPDTTEDENEDELSPFDTVILSQNDTTIKTIAKKFDSDILAHAL